MNIVIVDDDRLVCESLKIILEANQSVTVTGIGYDGGDAISLYDELAPDILLMDIRMGNMSGLQAAEVILSAHPHARILFLTTFSDDEYIVRALKLGARGYIVKQNFDSILPALQAVFSGQNVFGDAVMERLPLLLKPGHPDFSCYGITEKEKELIGLVAQGLSNREIARQLYLSEGTVRNYLSVILEKLHLHDRTQLAVFYYHTAPPSL